MVSPAIERIVGVHDAMDEAHEQPVRHQLPACLVITLLEYVLRGLFMESPHAG